MQTARHHYFVMQTNTWTIDFWNWDKMRNYFCDTETKVTSRDLKKMSAIRLQSYHNYKIVFDPAKINTGIYRR